MLTKETLEEYHKYYLDIDDPTEYTFITRYIGTLEDWDTLCTNSWLKPVITQWRRELELKIKSKALRALREVALGDTRDSFVANKYLLDNIDNFTFSSLKKGRGRPSKQEVLAEATKIALEENRLREDFKIINDNRP